MSEDDVDIGDIPTAINPYDVLSVPQNATQDDIKKAYRKAALKHHPDKVAEEDKSAAHTRFQEIAFAFAVLSDERRRRRYDTTGRTEDTLDLDDDDFDWVSFFRAQFASAITEATINKFADEYRHGDEEREAVLKAYTRHKGSMERLYNEVMLSDMVEDEDRFRAIIDDAIASGKVESFPQYTTESEATRKKRIEREKKKKEKEAREAEKIAHDTHEDADGDDGGAERGGKKPRGKKSGKSDSTADLAALIQQRQRGREGAQDDFFARLEAKYAPKGSKRAPIDEPDEEAFARNAKKKSRVDEGAESSRKSRRAKK